MNFKNGSKDNIFHLPHPTLYWWFTTQKDFARLLNKRDSEISKWLTGRHNFTTQTIARIETALGSKLISIAH